MLFIDGMFLSNKVHESRSLRMERGIQARNHATLCMEMCSALGRSTGVCTDRWYTWFLVSTFLQKNLPSKVRKNTEKAEMNKESSAQPQQEHGKHKS